MANPDAKNVSFGKPKATGGVFVAPAGTPVPVNATSALDAAFVGVGYISEDGMVNGLSSDTENVNAWGGALVLVGQTNFMETFMVNLLESNINALKLFYGDANVTQSGNTITIKQNNKELAHMVVVFEIVMTGGRIKRIVIADGQIVDRSGEITYTDGDPITYPCLFQAYPDTDGNSHVEYIALIGS